MSDSSDSRLSNLSQLFSKFKSFVSLIAGLVTIAIGIDQLAKNDWDWRPLAAVLLVAGFLLVWWWFFRLWRSPKTAGKEIGFNVKEEPGSHSLEKRQKLGRFFTFALPVIVLGFGIGWYLLNRSTDSDKVIVLVADFDGQDKSYGVTETIIDHLREATKAFDDSEVVSLKEVITAQDGSAVARAKGEEQGASVVLWGWYRVPEDTALVTAHFEVLAREDFSLLKTGRWIERIAVAELTFQVQVRLSEEMEYLTLLALGLIHYERSNFDRALERWSAAKSLPNVPTAMLDQAAIHVLFGNAYLGTAEYDSAVVAYNRAVAIEPSFIAYHNRGIAYNLTESPDSAIADFNRAIALDSTNATTYINRGYAYFFKCEYTRAFADFDQAITLGSQDALAYMNRGSVYLREEKYDLAITDFNQAIALDPSQAEAYVNLGSAFAEKGEYDSAITAYSRAIALDRDLAQAHANRGMAYHDKDEYSLAIGDYSEAIALDSISADVYYSRSSAYRSIGDTEKAQADYERFERLERKNRQESQTCRSMLYSVQAQ